ncbi:MAG: anti-sigma factor domain-containing protein [Alicyclobacillaceae bacterium]|nr:anti-sigma factor domain-containing protein [Alicyclobacillaceae bacterium]
MKGIVVKTDGKEAIVLTRDRRFVRIQALPGMTVGQETEIPQESLRVRTRGSSPQSLRIWVLAAVAASMLAVAVGWRFVGGYLSATPAYAYVTVDVDGAVEFAVNAEKRVTDSQVVGVSGNNAKVPDVHGIPVAEAVAAWVRHEVAQHKLRDGGEVFIATTAGPSASPEDIEQLNRKIAYAVAEAVKRDVDLVHVDALQVPEEIRQEALAEGISPGRYYLYVAARNRGLAVSLEEFRQQSIAVLLNNHRELTGLLQQIRTDGENGVF